MLPTLLAAAGDPDVKEKLLKGMLRYCQSHPGATIQLMVNHDDAAREFAYAEPDTASLKAAAANGWTVVSMKDDWKNIFAFEDK